MKMLPFYRKLFICCILFATSCKGNEGNSDPNDMTLDAKIEFFGKCLLHSNESLRASIDDKTRTDYFRTWENWPQVSQKRKEHFVDRLEETMRKLKMGELTGDPQVTDKLAKMAYTIVDVWCLNSVREWKELAGERNQDLMAELERRIRNDGTLFHFLAYIDLVDFSAIDLMSIVQNEDRKRFENMDEEKDEKAANFTTRLIAYSVAYGIIDACITMDEKLKFFQECFLLYNTTHRKLIDNVNYFDHYLSWEFWPEISQETRERCVSEFEEKIRETGIAALTRDLPVIDPFAVLAYKAVHMFFLISIKGWNEMAGKNKDLVAQLETNIKRDGSFFHFLAYLDRKDHPTIDPNKLPRKEKKEFKNRFDFMEKHSKEKAIHFTKLLYAYVKPDVVKKAGKSSGN